MNNTEKINKLKRTPTSECFLNIIQLNCNSLTNKLAEIKMYLYSTKPDIACLSETMIKKTEPKILGYTCLWKHRQGERGGLCIMVRHDICLLYTSPSPRDKRQSRMPSSA